MHDIVNPEAEVYVADNQFEFEKSRPQDSSQCRHTDEEAESDDVDDFENEDQKAEEELKKLRDRLGVVPYYAVDYIAPEVVIIVGGETEGLSSESLTFLEERDGVRVNVPLHNGIESLNTSMALGIITYEINRQFTQKQDAKITQKQDVNMNN